MSKKDKKSCFKKSDLRLLCKYALNCNFIIETGAGVSTKYFASLYSKNKAKIISIELNKKRCKSLKEVKYKIGWSIAYDDILIPESNRSNKTIDGRVKYYKRKIGKGFDFGVKECRKRIKDFRKEGMIAYGADFLMEGETDLIRKTLKKYSELELDFFFCDSGEYCGLAEWNIVKNEIKVGGYFAIHDIYYPKSIKGFKVAKKIENNNKWKILEKTKSKQGLLIAQKIK